MIPDELRLFLQPLLQEIEAAIAADLSESTAGRDPLLSAVLGHALAAGGKRIRPVLCLAAARLCGGSDAALPVAVGLEYLHTATLIHDDVIDGADRRRGRATVHTRFGMAAAILAGDWLHARSLALIGAHGGGAGLAIICGATADMVNGEFLQLGHQGDPRLQLDGYLQVLRCKTAVLLAAACELGAVAAGVAAESAKALAAYGMDIGISFQLSDDLLDYLGDPEVTGKKRGSDLAEGKATLPFIIAMQTAAKDGQEELARLFGQGGDEVLAAARRKIEALDGFGQARRMAQVYGDRARAALSVFDAAAPEARFLHGLAAYVLSRDK